MKFSGRLVDIFSREIYPAEITVQNGQIAGIKKTSNSEKQFILPGLIDAHVHIESSMLTPSAFAAIAVKHGTIGAVSDPHEIANVMGYEGVRFMIRNGSGSDFRFCFGAPSCVPATDFETSGATLTAAEIEDLFKSGKATYLSEMMNFPGVIYGDSNVLNKLRIASLYNKPVDGHAPGITGEALAKYVNAGISTDHECSSADEGREKISLGMKILIREGSAARNLDSLKILLKEHPEMCMLCSDDIHPEMLLTGHINRSVARLISEGYDIFDVIRAATLNPISHYKINSGLLRTGDPADFILVDNLETMKVRETWINGKPVWSENSQLPVLPAVEEVNRFNASPLSAEDITVKAAGERIRVIEAEDGELLTKELIEKATIESGNVISDTEKDILKIVVKDRYHDSPVSIAFIKGFGLKHGAIASSVAHDSHNIIAVGVEDEDICNAVNRVISLKGGLSCSYNGETESLPLPVAGIMSDKNCEEVAGAYEKLSKIAGQYGSSLAAPFMTLSFMALLVIPELKLSDKGLFDGRHFKFASLFAD